MTPAMGLKGWKESWSGRRCRRRSSTGGEQTLAAANTARTGVVVSEVSSLTDYSLERPHTRDTGPYLPREASSLSSQVDTTSYQEKLQGWSALFHDDDGATVLAPRPGTSLNPTRPFVARGEDIQREFSFLQNSTNKPAAFFPVKPREIDDPLAGLTPSGGAHLVSQRKYYVLPSIGSQADFLLRRQRSNVETLNQLDYARDDYEDDAQFFAELIELKRESRKASTPYPAPAPPHTPSNPLPPISRLRDVVRPRTNIAELDEDRYAVSGHTSPSAMSVISDVEEFRGRTPDPDYADTSPRKASFSSQVAMKSTDRGKKTSVSVAGSVSVSGSPDTPYLMDQEGVLTPDAQESDNGPSASR